MPWDETKCSPLRPLQLEIVELLDDGNLLFGRSVVAEWSTSVAFKPGVSQRRFESGRRQTVTITACILRQGSLNLSVTSPMKASDTETDVKLNICFYEHQNSVSLIISKIDCLLTACATEHSNFPCVGKFGGLGTACSNEDYCSPVLCLESEARNPFSFFSRF